MYGTYAKRVRTEDYPWAPTPEERQRWYDLLQRDWGRDADLAVLAPSIADDPQVRQWWGSYLRQSASPGAALALARMNTQIDIRQVLPAIRVPTLLIHRTGDRDIDVGGARWMAERIPGARYVELPGDDHLPWAGDQDALLGEIEEFLTGVRHVDVSDRVLATVLFTDIVGSTERAAAVGDREWRELLSRHHALVRREVERFRGREIDTAGDGFLVSFDGPARGIRCACAIRDGVRAIGLEIRAGLHTGECEVMGDQLTGLAVHTGARVAALAGPSEVLVSSTVRDLVAGAGLEFADRGEHELKGVPGSWHLFAVQG